MYLFKKQKAKNEEEEDVKKTRDEDERDWKESAQRQSHVEELRNNPPQSFGVANEAKRLGYGFKELEFEFKVPGKPLAPFYGFTPADETTYRPLRYTCLGFAFGTYDIATDEGYSIVTSYILRALGSNDDWRSVATYPRNDGFVNIKGDVGLEANDVIGFVQTSGPLYITADTGFHAVIVKRPFKIPGEQYYDLSNTVVVDKPGELP